jgi:hypothetical protein
LCRQNSIKPVRVLNRIAIHKLVRVVGYGEGLQGDPTGQVRGGWYRVNMFESTVEYQTFGIIGDCKQLQDDATFMFRPWWDSRP